MERIKTAFKGEANNRGKVEDVTLDGILKDDTIFDLRPTRMYHQQVYIAENEEGKTGFVADPKLYAKVGRDEDFREVYEKV